MVTFVSSGLASGQMVFERIISIHRREPAAQCASLQRDGTCNEEAHAACRSTVICNRAPFIAVWQGTRRDGTRWRSGSKLTICKGGEAGRRVCHQVNILYVLSAEAPPPTPSSKLGENVGERDGKHAPAHSTAAGLDVVPQQGRGANDQPRRLRRGRELLFLRGAASLPRATPPPRLVRDRLC